MTPAKNSIPESPLGWRWIFVFGLVAVMLILPGASAMNPILYSQRDSSATVYHQDLVATGDLTRADAELVLQEWATSLNLTGSFIHNVKLREYDVAERSLPQFRASDQNLKGLVVQLGLNDTDVSTFQLDNHVNIVTVQKVLNETREFHKLQTPEVRFRDQKDIAGLKSVELQGENLRTEIHSDFRSFESRSDRVISLSRKFGLDTSLFEQSVTDFAAIVSEIDAVQRARSIAIDQMMEDLMAVAEVSLEILPDHGAYGDTLSMAGTVHAPTGTRVTVFVDGLQTGAAQVDNNGRFSLPYRIEQLEARSHTAYASVESDISAVSNFTVEARNTTISLGFRHVDENWIRKGIMSGRLLTEDGVPVRQAKVSINVDGQALPENGVTGDDGVYTITTTQLSPGDHTLKARFDPGGFPLNGSESAPVTVEGLSLFNWITSSLVYILAIGGAVVGGVLLFRGRQPIDAPPSAGTAAEEPAPLVEPHPMSTIEAAYQMADEIAVTSEGRADGHETVAQTYRRLVQELETKNPNLRLRSQTPRNLAVLFADWPIGEQFEVLVGIHERVLYAAYEPTEEDLHTVRNAFIYIITEGSGH